MSGLRAAVHVHSTWSYDGSFELADVARLLGRRRFGAVLTAEHDRDWDAERWAAYREACARVTIDTGTLVVPGIEYSDADNAAHVAVWGVEEFLGAGLATGELLERVAAHGGVAVLAHPARRAVDERVTPAWAGALAGIEVWNRKSDGWAPNNRALALQARHGGLTPVFGLDLHNARQLWPLAMRIAAPPELDAVLAALRARAWAPEALGLPGRRLLAGPPRRALAVAERARRPVAARVRQALNARRR